MLIEFLCLLLNPTFSYSSKQLSLQTQTLPSPQRLNAGWGPRRMCSTRDTCTIAIALPHRFSRPSRVRFCTLKANFRAATDREDDHCVKQRKRMHIVLLRELPSIRTFARSPSPSSSFCQRDPLSFQPPWVFVLSFLSRGAQGKGITI